MAAVKPNKRLALHKVCYNAYLCSVHHYVTRWPPLLSRLIQEDSNDENEDEDESTSQKESIFANDENEDDDERTSQKESIFAVGKVS